MNKDLNRTPIIERVHLIEIPDYALPELQVLSADIPDEMLKYHLQKAMREFTKRARTQIRNVTVQLQDCVNEYPMDLPEGEEFISFQQVSRHARDPAAMTTECGGYQLSWDVPSCTVVCECPPQCIVPVRFKVATAPSVTSCKVDEKIFSRNLDTLIHGAKSYLYAMSGEEVTWANASLAQFHDLKFGNGITSAQVDKMTGHASGRFKMQTRRIL